jgi:APA family basic amino acid/polyamine antiporter
VALNLGPTALVGKAETYVVAAKITLLMVFIAVGIAHISDGDFSTFAPEGRTGISTTTALLFTAYTGFNVVVNMAGSVANPEKTVPLAVLGSIMISALIYVGVILAMLASGVEQFGAAGVGEAAQALMGDWGAYLIAFAACLSTLSGANANVLATSELSLRLVAQDDVPPVLGRTGPGGHPYVSVCFIGWMTLVLVLLANIDNIVALANVGALLAMVVVNVACISLIRKGSPGAGLRLPILVPILGVLTCLSQFPFLQISMVLLGLALMVGGLLLFVARHRRDLGEGWNQKARAAVERLETPLSQALRGPVAEVESLTQFLGRGREDKRSGG